MTIDAPEAIPTAAGHPVVPIGLSKLVKMAFDGADLAPLWNTLVARVTSSPFDSAAFIDLSMIAHIQGRPGDRAVLEARALELQRLYRQPPAATATKIIKLLVFKAPGDFMANMPIEFMVEGSSVTLDMIYVVPGWPLPEPIPDHDVALVAVAESDENQPLLRDIARTVSAWPRPVINRPEMIARLTRDGTSVLLKSAPGVVIPTNVRIDRQTFERIAFGNVSVEDFLEGQAYPIIARPVGSHAGNGLAKLDDVAAIDAYLRERTEPEFYIAPFVDYRGDDGLFRKYRIALIDGRPYACHMAISRNWMIHYLNADMRDNAEHRDEEARFMANFDKDFAVRHKIALSVIAERAGLEYLPFDCGETREGKLLVFEVGTNMVVHAMDPPDLFPYKGPQLEKVFGAFQAMLQKHALQKHALHIDA